MQGYVVFLRVLAFFAVVATLRAGDFLPLVATFGLGFAADARSVAAPAAALPLALGFAAAVGFAAAEAVARAFLAGASTPAVLRAGLVTAVARARGFFTSAV